MFRKTLLPPGYQAENVKVYFHRKGLNESYEEDCLKLVLEEILFIQKDLNSTARIIRTILVVILIMKWDVSLCQRDWSWWQNLIMKIHG